MAKPRRVSLQAFLFVVMLLVNGVTIPCETGLEQEGLKTHRMLRDLFSASLNRLPIKHNRFITVNQHSVFQVKS